MFEFEYSLINYLVYDNMSYPTAIVSPVVAITNDGARLCQFSCL